MMLDNLRFRFEKGFQQIPETFATSTATLASPDGTIYSFWTALKATRRRVVAICLIAVLFLTVIIALLSGHTSRLVTATKGRLPVTFGLTAAQLSGVPPVIDHFRDFDSTATCKISSLDLFVPTKPVCKDKESLLKAMSWGGRVGFDAPYQPRGCDMQWFSTEEICKLLSRYSRIYLVGDSLARNIGIAMHILLRGDYVHGGGRFWENGFKEVADVDCTCEHITENRNCSWFRGLTDSNYAYKFKPETMRCPQESTGTFEFHVMTSHPLAQDQLDGIATSMPVEKPSKPVAFVMSHGLWNDMEYEKTMLWLSDVLGAANKAAPWLKEDDFEFPQLLVTPNAAGDKKPDTHQALQNNMRIMFMEKKVAELLEGTGIDHIGMFNMSVQSVSWDGTHAAMRTDLLKCMMILNWLNAFDLSNWIPG